MVRRVAGYGLRREPTTVPWAKIWIPAFAGMTGSGNWQLLNRIGISGSRKAGSPVVANSDEKSLALRCVFG